MQINDESFSSLEKYGRAQGEHQKVYLKLTMKDGELSLQACTSKEMGLKDKFMSALHLGDFSTKKIAAFISSDPFYKLIESKERTPGTHKALVNAYKTVLGQIPKQSDKALFQTSTKDLKIRLARVGEAGPDRVHMATAKCFRPSPLPAQFAYLINKGASLTPKEVQKLQEIGEKRLLAEVEQGLVVIDPKNHSVVLPTKDHWYAQLTPFLNEGLARELQNKAMLHQELRLAKARPGDSNNLRKQFVEVICKERGLQVPSNESIAKAKKAALEDLLKNKDLLKLAPEGLRHHIDWHMHQAILLAHGIPEKEIIDCGLLMGAISTLTNKAFSNTETYIQKILSQPKIQSLLPIARQALSLQIAGELNLKTKASLDKVIERSVHTQPLEMGLLKLELFYQLAKMALRKDFIAVHHETIRPALAFFKKWQGNLKTEMNQGMNSSDEVLGRGVCYALSLRWAQDAIQRSAITPDEMHTIGPKDRYHQAALGIDPQALTTGSKDVETSFGLQSMLRIESKQALRGKNQIQKQLLQTLNDPRFQHPYNGVAQVLFAWTTKENDQAGHAITLVCQENKTHPEQSIFRFSDPNYGTFEFPVTTDPASARQQCLNALSDLLVHMYSKKIDCLNLNCFRIAENS